MHQLHIQNERMRGHEILQLAGAIDPLNFPKLAAVLNRLLTTAAARVILECSDVTYISSAELSALLDFAHIARSLGGDLKCVGLAPTIEQVVNLIANGDPIECFPSLNQALEAAGASRVALVS